VVSFDDVKQVAAFLPGYGIVVQLVHANTDQSFDMFALMFATSLKQARIAYERFKAA
jgi:hypothetical protein